LAVPKAAVREVVVQEAAEPRVTPRISADTAVYNELAFDNSVLYRCLQNNLRAYEIYLQSEAVIFDDFFSSFSSQQSPKEEPKAWTGVWNYEQILEMTTGSVSKVLGDRYAVVDTYPQRARLPAPPFMFVDRVTYLDAEFGQYRPSRMIYEYDIRDDCILLMAKSTISYVLLTESAHAAILLFSYIGIDVLSSGTLRYRILDTEVQFHSDFPILGDTLRGILDFVSYSKNGATTLVKLQCSCFSGDRLVMSMNLTGGFFTAQDLTNTKGVLTGAKQFEQIEHTAPDFGIAAIRRQGPLLLDLDLFFNGDYGPKMYATRDAETAEKLYINPLTRMVDRIIALDFDGGTFGCGQVVAEKHIDSSHWSFLVHFINDPVLPGSLLAEVSNQLQILFALNTGHLDNGDYYLSSLKDLAVKSYFRGQVRPVDSIIRYEQSFRKIIEVDGKASLVSDCNVYWQGIHIVKIQNISVCIERRDSH
jgi:3-hydroxymyristoyl/3-hydroxydecanoyl-(acyl carrier protein) dehydratase